MKSQLITPTSYKMASEKEKDAVCNGCGTSGWKGWLVPNTMYGLSVCKACNRHDWMYHEGRTEAEKDWADKVFLFNLRAIIDEGTWFEWLRKLRRVRAFEYYTAVVALGDSAFWANKERKD